LSIAKKLYDAKRFKERPTSFRGVRVYEHQGAIRLYRQPDACGKKERNREMREWRKRTQLPKGKNPADVLLRERGPRGISYNIYLQTTHWKFVSQRAFDLDSGKCVRCEDKGEAAHHRTYERLGAELPDDVVTLCRRCHHRIHSKNRPLNSVKRRRKKNKEKSPASSIRRLEKEARRVLGGVETRDPEVQKIVDVFRLKCRHRGSVTVRRCMSEMGYRK
jgi:5-methylcytosine-specific restriction endonuclease McrA